MADAEWRSSDGRFGLLLPERAVWPIADLCVAGGHETGGVVVGNYSRDHSRALVCAMSPPPADSRSGPAWFVRGADGLKRWLRGLWCNPGWYYLGEWHFHPAGAPHPSPLDFARMAEISASARYRCPEPVLLVLAPGPSASLVCSCHVFPVRLQPVALLPAQAELRRQPSQEAL